MASQDQAGSRYDRPYEIVSEQMDAMSKRADNALAKANAAIDGLSLITADLDTLPPTPSIDLPNDQLTPFPSLPAPDPNKFGGIDPIEIPPLDLDISGDEIQIDPPPVFSPSVISVNIPSAPAPLDTGGVPDRPDMLDVVIPGTPNLQLPSIGQMVDIDIPTFDFPEIPAFDGQAPEFTADTPNTILQWAEPTYQSVVLVDVKERLQQMLAGGTGLPAAVEQALFDRARNREDQVAYKAIDEATQAFSARGFELPPGALVKQINAARESAMLNASELAREILTKSAEWEIENLRQAVQQGIALETVMMNSFDNMASRIFEAAKFRVQADIDLYNAQVSLFNANQNAYQTKANVYRTVLEAQLSKIEVYKAQIEGEQAKGQLNEQTVRIFTAQLQALSTQVEIYKAEMSGAQVQADLNKSMIDAYRADIQAYSEQLSAKKVEFDAYETSVRAEQAKIGILEAEARAFAATVQGYESVNNVKIQGLRAKIDVVNAQVAQYTAQLSGEQARVQAQLSNVQAMTAAYQADVGRYNAQVSAATAERQLEQSRVEANLRNNLAYYEIELKKYDASISRLIQQIQIQSEAIKAAGTMASQLAAGAMAATNVSASMSGSAGISSSDSLSTSHNHNYNES